MPAFKKQQSEELARLTEEFLNQGGKIAVTEDSETPQAKVRARQTLSEKQRIGHMGEGNYRTFPLQP